MQLSFEEVRGVKSDYIGLSDKNSILYLDDPEYYAFINKHFVNIGLTIITDKYIAIGSNGKIRDLKVQAERLKICDLNNVKTFQIKLSSKGYNPIIVNPESVYDLTIITDLMTEDIYLWLEKTLTASNFPVIKRLKLICYNGNFIHDIFTMIKDFNLDYLKVRGISNTKITILPKVKSLHLINFDDLTDISICNSVSTLTLNCRFRRPNIKLTEKLKIPVYIKNSCMKHLRNIVPMIEDVRFLNVRGIDQY